MAEFITELFQNIFTPGAGRPLIIATNATFATLQLTLGALLIATFSYHFAILSVLSAGLWASINWFIAETNLATARQAHEQRITKEIEDLDTKEKEDEGAAVVGEGTTESGTKGIEVVEVKGELIDRKKHTTDTESNTEDEWEKVGAESEKDK